jgi:hypothetical protein
VYKEIQEVLEVAIEVIKGVEEVVRKEVVHKEVVRKEVVVEVISFDL